MTDTDRATVDVLAAQHESITELERVTDEVLEKFEELRDGQKQLEIRASKHSGEMIAIRGELANLRDSQNRNFETILAQLRRLTPIPPK
jgi:chromosome segregation ATPase